MTELTKLNYIPLSANGYARICDYSICNRFIDTYPRFPKIDLKRLENLKDNDKLFLNGENLVKFNLMVLLNKIFQSKNIKNLIILISNVEPILKNDHLEKLYPFSKEIYLVNKHTENNGPYKTKIYNLPIGIRDGFEVHPNHVHFSHSIIINEKKQKREKDILCYLCFSVNTDKDRQVCLEYLGDKEFVFNMNNKSFPRQKAIHCGKVPVELNYEMTHRSKYTLSPRGCGISTHRFYEALYLDSIPVVKRTNTPFDKLYNVFPCLVIDEWNEVTRDLLEEKYNEMNETLLNFKNKYPDWANDATSLLELLKET